MEPTRFTGDRPGARGSVLRLGCRPPSSDAPRPIVPRNSGTGTTAIKGYNSSSGFLAAGVGRWSVRVINTSKAAYLRALAHKLIVWAQLCGQSPKRRPKRTRGRLLYFMVSVRGFAPSRPIYHQRTQEDKGTPTHNTTDKPLHSALIGPWQATEDVGCSGNAMWCGIARLYFSQAAGSSDQRNLPRAAVFLGGYCRFAAVTAEAFAASRRSWRRSLPIRHSWWSRRTSFFTPTPKQRKKSFRMRLPPFFAPRAQEASEAKRA